MVTDLITRLSKLVAPDREVDALIAAELEPHIFDAPGFTPVRPIPSFHIDPQGDAIRFDGGGIMCLSYFPRYTASVDAVIALAERVLPGWRVENLCEWEDETLRSRGPWTCDLRKNGENFFSPLKGKCGHAPTPAIALLIALLRAKEASKL